MENVRNHRDIKLVTTNAKRKLVVSQSNYRTCKCFSEDLMAIELKKTRVYMNKPIYVGQAVLDISKRLMYTFFYDYLKPKYWAKVKLCYMDTDSFIFHVYADDFYKDTSDDVFKWFGTSDYNENDNRLLTGINKKVIGKFKDELKCKVMTEFVALASKVYAYLDDNNKGDKRDKRIKRCVRDKVLGFDNYKHVILLNKTVQKRFKSDHHIVTTEEVNKIALSRKDDKCIRSFDGITTYPYGINSDLLNELENVIKNKSIQLYY